MQAHSPSTAPSGNVPTGTSQLADPALAVLLGAPHTKRPGICTGSSHAGAIKAKPEQMQFSHFLLWAIYHLPAS